MPSVGDGCHWVDGARSCEQHAQPSPRDRFGQLLMLQRKDGRKKKTAFCMREGVTGCWAACTPSSARR